MAVIKRHSALIRIAAVTLSFLAIANSANAAVTKAEIRARIQTLFIAEAQKHTLGSTDSPDEATIEARAKSVADTVTEMKPEAVNDKLAEWIVQSAVEIVNSNHPRIFASDDQAKKLFAERINRLKMRFHDLTETDGDAMMLKGDKLWVSSQLFEVSLAKYIGSSLAPINQLNLELGPTAFVPNSRTSLSKIVAAIGNLSNPILSSDNQLTLDFRKSPIDNRLVGLALAHEINQLLQERKQRNKIIYQNLFSPGFDKGAVFFTTKEKGFAELQPQITQLFQQCLTKKSQTYRFSLERFESFLFSLDYLRFSQKPYPLPNLGNAPTAIVSIDNDENVWKLLTRQQVSQ